MKKWALLALFVVLYASGLIFYFGRHIQADSTESGTATNAAPATAWPTSSASALATDLTAVVSVRQTYEGLAETNLPFAQVAGKFLTYAGYKVSEEPVKKADLDLQIVAQGNPYRSPRKNDAALATQPNLTGTIALLGKGTKTKVVTFDSNKLSSDEEPPDAVMAKGEEDKAASTGQVSSLAMVFGATFPPRLAEVIGQQFGGRPLIAALRDRDPMIRDAAEKALMALVRANPLDRQVAGMLADIMDDEESQMRGRVVKILATTEDERLIPLFQGAIRDADPLVRANAAEALGAFPSPDVESALLKAMKDQDLRVRYRAAQSLGRTSCTQAVETLLAALDDSSGAVQDASVASLININDPSLTERVLALTDRPSEAIARHAVTLLGQSRDPRAVDFLVSMLSSNSPDLRDRAAESLGKIGDARAVDPLISALKDRDVFVRSSSAGALQHIPDRKAIDPLIAALDDDNIMRMSVLASLEKLTGMKLGDQPDAWRAWWDSVKDSKDLHLPFEQQPPPAAEVPAAVSPWPVLAVGGVMKGKDGKPGTAVINSRIIREKEIVEGVTLHKVLDDAVELTYRKQTRIMKVNESTWSPGSEPVAP